MPVDIILGLQWGDEGKGKVVDVFAPHYDIVARFQGGPNAGHTIKFGDEKHVLHLIPSGIFHPNIECLIGNGVVIDPIVLRREVQALEAIGMTVRDTLFLSDRAHLILPTHKLLDAASEKAKGDKKIGSTLRGIGPTYMDKTGRNGLRVGDVHFPDFKTRYTYLVNKHRRLLAQYEGFEYNLPELEPAFFEAIDFIRSMRSLDSAHYLDQALRAGKKVLAEGAQGTLLDIDFGSYPFVTSSSTTAAGACIGLGIAPRQIDRVFGVFKAYCTRVGSGPFPTELNDEMGENLRAAGGEFGATTGRPRRCGWIDLPLLRYAIRLNGVTDLVMTKADVLSGLGSLKACEHYSLDGKRLDEAPYRLDLDVVPAYNDLPSWEEDITGLQDPGELPDSLADYIRYLEAFLETPLSYLSVGPGRAQMFPMRSS